MAKKKKKKETRQVRLSLRDYEQIRKLAFRYHKPMTDVLAAIIDNYEPPV